MKQRALARAGRPRDSQGLAGLQLEGNTAQYDKRTLQAAILLANIGDSQGDGVIGEALSGSDFFLLAVR